MFARWYLFCVLSACVSAPLVTITVAHAADNSARPLTLGEIVDLAVEHNPAMAGAQGDKQHSRGQQIVAGAYLNPSISGSVGPGSIRDPSSGVGITERMITVEQPLEWQGKRRARQQAANAGAAGASAAMDETRLNVVADVKIAFYHMLQAQQEVDLSVQNLKMVEEVLRTVKARAAAGDATVFETMKATVETQKATKDVTRAQNALIVARGTLNMAAGGALGDPFSIQGDFELLRQEPDRATLTAQALDQHPVLRRLTQVVEQAEFRTVMERESRVPTVSVHATYRRDAGAEAVVAGLSVPIPLWYQRQGEIESARGDKYRAEAQRLRAQQELSQTITQHVQAVRTSHAQLQVFETGLLKQAEQTLKVARISFQQGVASLLDLLDAQRVHRQTLLEYVQARADLSVAMAQLERAAGGI